MNTHYNENISSAGRYSQADLVRENQQFVATGGTSANNREEGFVPAFLDTATGHVYRSCFANGTPAPIHLLDGLPGDLVIARDADRRAIAFKPTIVAGFLRADRFYTREQAAQSVSKFH